MTNVILVDDHELFRLGIRGSLKRADVCILGEAESGKQLFTLLKTLKPDLIFLDIILPDTTGIDIARRLRDSFPEIKILILSAENTMETVSDLLRIGIDGFISKRRCNSIELAKAVRVIMEGENYYGRSAKDSISAVAPSRPTKRTSSKSSASTTPTKCSSTPSDAASSAPTAEASWSPSLLHTPHTEIRRIFLHT